MEELGVGNEGWRGSKRVLESDTLSSLLSLLNAKKVRSISKRLFILLKAW